MRALITCFGQTNKTTNITKSQCYRGQSRDINFCFSRKRTDQTQSFVDTLRRAAIDSREPCQPCVPTVVRQTAVHYRTPPRRKVRTHRCIEPKPSETRTIKMIKQMRKTNN